jgi:hypothetical protein
MRLLRLKKADDGVHKFVAVLEDGSKSHNIAFGAKGYTDFTKTRNNDKKSNYIARHKVREDWSKDGVLTPGFWSRWILWNKPTLEDSVKYTVKKFHLI